MATAIAKLDAALLARATHWEAVAAAPATAEQPQTLWSDDAAVLKEKASGAVVKYKDGALRIVRYDTQVRSGAGGLTLRLSALDGTTAYKDKAFLEEQGAMALLGWGCRCAVTQCL
jgi:hypothetical protein